MAEVIVVSALEGAAGELACAAALACALAGIDRDPCGVVLVEAQRERPRGPTLLASDPARRLEGVLRAAGHSAAARGRVAWVTVDGSNWGDAAHAISAAAAAGGARFVVIATAAARLRTTLA